MSDIEFEQVAEMAQRLSRDERFRLIENILATLKQETIEATSQDFKPRILGLHAHLGPAWMSDDFCAELPDEFWLGDE